MLSLVVLKVVLIFIATSVLDLLWTLYIIKSSQHRKWSASIFSALITLMTTFTVVSYIEDRYLVIPAVIGAFTGTYFTLHFTGKREEDAAKRREGSDQDSSIS